MSKHTLHNEFTAIMERDGKWYIGYCPEIPGANGQGETVEECKKNLADAIALILQDRREDVQRGIPAEPPREGRSHSLWVNPRSRASVGVDQTIRRSTSDLLSRPESNGLPGGQRGYPSY